MDVENRLKRFTTHSLRRIDRHEPAELTDEELDALESQAMEALAAMVEVLGKEAKPDVRVTRLAKCRCAEPQTVQHLCQTLRLSW